MALIIKRLGFIFIIFINVFLFTNCIMYLYKWHNEKYILEGSGYFLICRNNVKEKKQYFVAGEEVTIGMYPQNNQTKEGSIRFEKITGPYKIRISFSPGFKQENKKILIHNVKIKSTLNRLYDISKNKKYPINVEKKPFYSTRDIKKLEKRNPNYKVSYDYLFNSEIDLNFKDKEVIYLILDVEVIKDNFNKREQISLKIIPLLDKGFKWRVAGDDV